MTEVRVGDLASLPEDQGTCVVVGGEEVAVFRSGDQVFALADRCSHAEASLCEGEVFDGEVECPRHGAAFSIRTGEALTLPATKPVTVYAATIRDGDVYVRIETSEDDR